MKKKKKKKKVEKMLSSLMEAKTEVITSIKNKETLFSHEDAKRVPHCNSGENEIVYQRKLAF